MKVGIASAAILVLMAGNALAQTKSATHRRPTGSTKYSEKSVHHSSSGAVASHGSQNQVSKDLAKTEQQSSHVLGGGSKQPKARTAPVAKSARSERNDSLQFKYKAPKGSGNASTKGRGNSSAGASRGKH